MQTQGLEIAETEVSDKCACKVTAPSLKVTGSSGAAPPGAGFWTKHWSASCQVTDSEKLKDEK